jgi:hypothetical protein
VQLTEDHLIIDGVSFAHGPLAGRSTRDHLFIGKPEPLLRRYLALMETVRGGRIVELGIAQGGSAAAATLIAEPELFVAVDICDPVPPLDGFIGERDLQETLRLHYNVDQGDRAAMEQIVRDDLCGGPLDLIVDDASHLFSPTLVSFETLFPLLRPGGRYLIEDWHWEVRYCHEFLRVLAEDVEAAGDILTTLAEPSNRVHELSASVVARWLRQEPPPRDLEEVVRRVGFPAEDFGYRTLAEIVPPLTAAVVTSPDLVARVEIDPDWIIVERGPGSAPDGWTLLGPV